MAESPVVTPDEGTELCYECDGSCLCWHCRGEGFEDGVRCITCNGGGKCIVCNGEGQLWLGTTASVRAAHGKRFAIRVGCFRELGYDGPWTLEAARGRRSPEHLAEVIAYLRAGKILVLSPGLVRDFYDNSRVAGNRSLRTDGMFTWPDSLAYYVEHYGVELPPVFEANMAGRGYVFPRDVDVNGLEPLR